MAENVNQIIDRIRALHHQIAARFEGIASTTDKERLRLVSDYIGRHERNLAEALAKYQDSAARAVVNTWFKTTPGHPLIECLEKVQLDASDTPQLIRSVLEMDRCLVSSFRSIADGTPIVEVRDFFQQLVEMEERQEHKLIRDAIEMEDL